ISALGCADAAPGAVTNNTTIVPKPSGPPPPPPLPSPWVSQDIGSPGIAGSASYASGTFTVKAAGSDIWGMADGFRYLYQSIAGDGQIVVRVAGLQNTNTFAKAGVMLRATTTAGSAHVI